MAATNEITMDPHIPEMLPIMKYQKCKCAKNGLLKASVAHQINLLSAGPITNQLCLNLRMLDFMNAGISFTPY